MRACIQEGTTFDVLLSKALETAAARKQYYESRSEDDKKAFEEACAASANFMTDPVGKVKRFRVVQGWNEVQKGNEAERQEELEEATLDSEFLERRGMRVVALDSEFLERRGMRVVYEYGDWFLYGLRPADAF